MSINRELLTFIIIDRKIFYSDRKFGSLIRLIPKPQNLILTIQKTRNKVPMFIAQLFNLTQEELDEYDKAITVDQLADIVVRDGKKNGCLLVANADMEAEEELVKKIEQSEVII